MNGIIGVDGYASFYAYMQQQKEIYPAKERGMQKSLRKNISTMVKTFFLSDLRGVIQCENNF